MVGDVLGHWVVDSSIWNWLWQIFRDTESYIALEKHVRSVVQATLLAAAGAHPGRQHLTELQRVGLRAALQQHIEGTPSAQTLKSWMLRHLTGVLTPMDCVNLCMEVISCHGAVCNIDFSCSDGDFL